MVIAVVLGLIILIAVCLAVGGIRIVGQIERGVVFRFGRAQREVRQPGLTLLIPVVDRMKKVNVQIVTMPVPTQECITRDNVSVEVDAVAYFRVEDPLRAAIAVQNYLFAIEQVAQTSLRSIIGKSDLDDLLSNREELNRGLALMIDSPALGWGVHIDRVEIKDVHLPEGMKRSIARQAEAERERRARVITADGEFQAARKLSDASAIMTETPGALQLRLLQTVVEVAAEKTSTLVMPLPVELLRFFERSARSAPAAEAAAQNTDGPSERRGAEQPAVTDSPTPELAPPGPSLEHFAAGLARLARQQADAPETQAADPLQPLRDRRT
ncbi:SPFH domain-containing protein [Nonomuraea zeae]|uniref:Slipin family protein n=1 Tax=Nonomuraea zeae TaxID=1642303 RepID=A0A5S4H5A1_9ACTN|nr:SPFH domain-containing protein [Nonomuraea zeae]TMR39891.1 slipin family protein [Nonomuraea zeae]